MKKQKVLLAGLLVAVLAVLAWLVQIRSEPAYQGKRLSYWLKDLENWDGNTNGAAFMAFRNMGPKAIPPLLSVLQSGNGPIRRMLMEVNNKQSLVQFQLGKPWVQTMAATWALYSMGPNARPALPVLSNLLFFHPTETIASATAMAGIGPDALPCLLSALTNQNYRIRFAAVSGLGWEQSDLNIVVPALIGSLHDTDSTVRHGAAISLGELHAESNIAVPALINDFPGNDSLFRSLILFSLSEFKNDAQQAIPMIVEALKDSDIGVSNSAALALKQIDPVAAAKAGIK